MVIAATLTTGCVRRKSIYILLHEIGLFRQDCYVCMYCGVSRCRASGRLVLLSSPIVVAYERPSRLGTLGTRGRAMVRLVFISRLVLGEMVEDRELTARAKILF